MAGIDKYFVGGKSVDFDYTDKETNIKNNIAYMFNRTNAMFKYNNLPATIPSKELELLLQSNGFGIFLEIDNDFYVVNGGLGGETDVYNRPTKAIISIPSLNYNKTLDINKECVVISNDSCNVGLLPMFKKYSFILNENMITMILANVNKRYTTLISANDDNTVTSAELFLKNIFDGKQGVIAENKLFDSLKVNPNTEDSGYLKDLIEFEQYIKASFYNEIGLSANYNMKKERITKEEFTTNSDSLYPLVDDMLNSRRKALEEINKLFDLDITVDFNSSWNIRSLENYSYINGLNQDKDTNIEDTIEENIEENTEENIEEIEPTDEENVEENVEEIEPTDEEVVEDDTKEPTDEEIKPTDEEVVEDDTKEPTDEEIEPTDEEVVEDDTKEPTDEEDEKKMKKMKRR